MNLGGVLSIGIPLRISVFYLHSFHLEPTMFKHVWDHFLLIIEVDDIASNEVLYYFHMMVDKDYRFLILRHKDLLKIHSKEVHWLYLLRYSPHRKGQTIMIRYILIIDSCLQNGM